MTKRKVDIKTKLLMDFFRSKGATFVDCDTGEEIEPVLKEPRRERNDG